MKISESFNQVKHNLLDANDLEITDLQSLTDNLLRKHVDFCDIYLQNSASENITIDDNIIKNANLAIYQGMSVRAICHDKTFMNHSSTVNSNSVKQLVDSLFIEQGSSQSYSLEYKHVERDISVYDRCNSVIIPGDVKTDMLRYINNRARKYSMVNNVIASINLDYDEICVIRSDNRIACDIRPLVQISITIIVEQESKLENGHVGFGGRISLHEITYAQLDTFVDKAYKYAILKLDAREAPGGNMPVVLGNGWAGVILHEAVGHGLEGDFNRKGSSVFSNKLNTQVASSSVTIIDDGTISNRRGSLNIDDEGNATHKTVLIENGVLRGYMMDEINARLMNMPITGNGRRESFMHAPQPRMTNTYMLGGDMAPEEIIASVEYGIYADSFRGGQVDITSGNFVFNADVAYMILNGQLAYPIKGCALVGNGANCLHHITMVGNDMALDDGIGTCGKNNQSVPVGVGQPTIRIDGGLVVGGAA